MPALSPALALALRVVSGVLAAALFGAGCVLGYVSVVALRRNEGVFLPAGYVALAFLAAAFFIGRAAVR